MQRANSHVKMKNLNMLKSFSYELEVILVKTLLVQN